MKGLRVIIFWFFVLLLCAVGLAVLFSALDIFDFRNILLKNIEMLLTNSIGLWSGGVLVGLSFVLFITHNSYSETIKMISFDNPEGEVSISVKAVEDFIKRTILDEHSITDIDPIIIPFKDSVRIKMRIAVIAGVNIPELTTALQLRVKERILTVLGVDNVASIEINVSKIIHKNVKKEDDQNNPEFAVPTSATIG